MIFGDSPDAVWELASLFPSLYLHILHMNIRIALGMLIPLTVACTTLDICGDTGQSELVARFKNGGVATAPDTVLTGLTLFGLRGQMPDSLLYDSVSASRVVLPLNPEREFSSFVIRTGTGSDTLTIPHTNQYYLISYNCGFATLFTIGQVRFAGTLIDRVEVVKAEVDAEMEQNEEHIWIYF